MTKTKLKPNPKPQINRKSKITIMITRNPSKKHFTLVELLVVLVIISLILGFIIPAFTKLTRGSSVEIAARMIASQLNLARAEAISRRCNVAVFMLGKNTDITSIDASGVNPDATEEWGYSAFRSAIVDGDGNFQEWVPGTQWTTVPQGALIFLVKNDNASPLLDGSNKPLNSWTPGTDDIQEAPRRVGFTPKGYSLNGDACITICEGIAYKENLEFGFIRPNFANCIVMKVNKYSGRVSYLYNGKL